MARAALDLGFYVSLAGIVTFPRAESCARWPELVPDDRLLIETDAPYLAPVPHRGKRNEPAFVGARGRAGCGPPRRPGARTLGAQVARNFAALLSRALGQLFPTKRLSALTLRAQLHYSETTGTQKRHTL